MKINLPSATGFLNPSRPRQGGMAVIVMLALLAIMLIYIAANIRTLSSLERELKLTEQRQVRRLQAVSAANDALHQASTNAAPAAAEPALPAHQ